MDNASEALSEASSHTISGNRLVTILYLIIHLQNISQRLCPKYRTKGREIQRPSLYLL